MVEVKNMLAPGGLLAAAPVARRLASGRTKNKNPHWRSAGVAPPACRPAGVRTKKKDRHRNLPAATKKEEDKTSRSLNVYWLLPHEKTDQQDGTHTKIKTD